MIPAESIDVIPLSWLPEPPDYAEAFQARNRKRRVAWLSWAMVVFGVVFAVAAFLGGEPGYAVFGLIIAVFFGLMGRFGSGYLFKKFPELQQPAQMTVDASSGITGDIAMVSMNPGAMKVTRGNWQFPWEQVAYALETDRVWVVHLTGRGNKVFFLIAKRGVTGPAHEEALRRLLTR